MLSKLVDAILTWAKEQPYWPRVQIVLVWLCAIAAAEVAAYQYIQWQYQLSPPPGMFLRSYISKRILVVFTGLLVAVIALRFRPTLPDRGAFGRVWETMRVHRRAILYRLTAVLLALTIILIGWNLFSPHRVSHIQIKFMDPPRDVKPDALAYLLYELNRAQKNWHFEVDFEPFNPAALKSDEQAHCEAAEDRVLCYAELWAAGRPAIGISRQRLGSSLFGQHRGRVSVITTADREAYEPLSDYEYLTYLIIVQSIVIHLEENGGLPEGAYRPGESSRGGVFQFTPQRSAIKSAILAAHLSPREQELLLNRFGAEYLRTCTDLLSMEWFRSPRVQGNLSAIFGAEPSGASK